MTYDQDYFADLPDEMVMQILLLLDYDSMLSARVCCIRFETLLTAIFEDKSEFKLDRWKNFKLARDNSECDWVFKSNKKFKNLSFLEFNFDDANDSDIETFFALQGDNIVNLHLSYCSAAEETLHKILDKVVNLKNFKLGLSRDIDGAKVINKLYDRCVEITFTSTTYIDKAEIEAISAERQTTIEELNLEFMRFRRRDEVIASFRDSGIYKLLQLIHTNLRRFELFPTNSDENILQQLSQLNLNLEHFKIYFNDEIDNSHMLTIVNQMKYLRKLDINGTLFSNDNANMIYDNLTELRSLTFRECDVLGNDGIINVTKLKKLEEFTINTCQNVTNHGIVHGIASKTNLTLKRLVLNERFSDDTLIAIVNNLPNLNALYLFSILFISSHLIPLVYERLINLKEFSISTLNEPKDVDMFEEQEVAKNLPEPKLRNPDIIISQLSELLVLQIYGYKTIPGASLLDIAQIPKLRQLTLHDYDAITHIDMIQLVTSLKNLRSINIRGCNDLDISEINRNSIRAAMNPKTEFLFNFDRF